MSKHAEEHINGWVYAHRPDNALAFAPVAMYIAKKQKYKDKMIGKITSGEYLKRYDEMTSQERDEYLGRVGEWLSSDGERLLAMTDRPMARTQNMMQMSVRWSREQCQAWQRGVRLLTALSGIADTWLPTVLYVKSAWRAVRKLTDELSAVRDNAAVEPAAEPQGTLAEPQGAVTEPAAEPQGAAAEPQGTAAEPQAAIIHDPSPVVPSGGVPARPKHIDQYVHLLPKGTQERAAKVRGLLRDMDENRERMRRLMRGDVSAQVMAGLSTAISNTDRELKKIYGELDAEWEKLVKSGRVVTDEIGQVHIVGNDESAAGQDAGEPDSARKRGRKPMTEEEKAEKSAERERKRLAARQKKAALIRKWLIDTRNAGTEEHKQKWMQRYREMVALGGKVTDKVTEAAAYY